MKAIFDSFPLLLSFLLSDLTLKLEEGRPWRYVEKQLAAQGATREEKSEEGEARAADSEEPVSGLNSTRGNADGVR